MQRTETKPAPAPEKQPVAITKPATPENRNGFKLKPSHCEHVKQRAEERGIDFNEMINERVRYDMNRTWERRRQAEHPDPTPEQFAAWLAAAPFGDSNDFFAMTITMRLPVYFWLDVHHAATRLNIPVGEIMQELVDYDKLPKAIDLIENTLNETGPE